MVALALAPAAALAQAPSVEAAPAPPPPPAPPSITGRITIDVEGTLIEPRVTDAVVYIDSHPSLDPPGPVEGLPAPPVRERPHLIQHERAFHPQLLVVANGTHVEFPNWDVFEHNVFSRSPAAPPFDLERYPQGRSKTYQFVRVGVVQIFCNIHPNMRATVVVTPNRHFSRVNEDGRFSLEGVPPGRYELAVWHPRTGEASAQVEVVAGGTAEVDLTLERSDADNPRAAQQRQRRQSRELTRGLGVERRRLEIPAVQESHQAWPGSQPGHDAENEGASPHHETAH
ncbi:MAG: carboxypeptidase regulatory-like domain-containing protein [Phycisphaeraceae bacterium]